MSDRDRAKWDEKWREMAGEPFLPSRLLTAHAALLTGGRALDLACGRGQNALWLARHGYQTLAVDISPVALAAARREAEQQGRLGDGPGQVDFCLVDLDEWRPEAAAFDLVAVFRFLDRRLFEPIRQAVAPAGLVVYETRHAGLLARLPGSTPDYLLEPGELLATFSGWSVLLYREDDENAAIIARKTG
jgi:SAM-dependent methyltransferase